MFIIIPAPIALSDVIRCVKQITTIDTSVAIHELITQIFVVFNDAISSEGNHIENYARQLLMLPDYGRLYINQDTIAKELLFELEDLIRECGMDILLHLEKAGIKQKNDVIIPYSVQRTNIAFVLHREQYAEQLTMESLLQF